MEVAAVSAFKQAVAKEGNTTPRVTPVSTIITDSGEGAYRAQRAADSVVSAAILKDVLVAANTVARAATVAAPSALIGDPGEGSFRTDFPDAWRALLSPLESVLSPAPRAAFVRFVSEEKPIFQ